MKFFFCIFDFAIWRHRIFVNFIVFYKVLHNEPSFLFLFFCPDATLSPIGMLTLKIVCGIRKRIGLWHSWNCEWASSRRSPEVLIPYTIMLEYVYVHQVLIPLNARLLLRIVISVLACWLSIGFSCYKTTKPHPPVFLAIGVSWDSTHGSSHFLGLFCFKWAYHGNTGMSIS